MDTYRNECNKKEKIQPRQYIFILVWKVMVYSRTIIIVIGHILIITLSGLAIKAFTPPLQSLMAVGIFIFQVIIFFIF